MSNITIVLRTDKINKKNIAPIHFRIVKNRRSSYISSGLSVPVKYWDDKNKRFKSGFPNSARQNKLLISKFNESQKQLLDLLIENKHVSVKNISKSIKGQDVPTFFVLAQGILDRSKAEGKIGTYDLRRSIIEKFRNFLNDSDIELVDITPLLLSRYDLHLQKEHENSANTRHRDFRFLKMVFKEAYKLDFLQGHPNPFDKYKIKMTTTSKGYLTEDEINKIEKVDLTSKPDLEKYRNLFLFGCTAYGIRVSDLLFLNESQLSSGRITIKTKKTNNQLDVKLPQKAIDILTWFRERNDGNPYVFGFVPADIDLKNDVMVDLILSRETAKYNKALKSIGKLAKVEKHFSSHDARHSWATRALRKGLDLYQVSALLTHASVKQTQVYAKIVSEELDKAADLF